MPKEWVENGPISILSCNRSLASPARAHVLMAPTFLLQGRATTAVFDILVHMVWLEAALPAVAELRLECVCRQPLSQVHPRLEPEGVQAGRPGSVRASLPGPSSRQL